MGFLWDVSRNAWLDLEVFNRKRVISDPFKADSLRDKTTLSAIAVIVASVNFILCGLIHLGHYSIVSIAVFHVLLQKRYHIKIWEYE